MDIELDRFDPRRPTVGAIPEVAIVIPTLNERDNIALLVERLARTLTSFPWEAIFVDDDSADGTIHEVRRIAQSDTRIRGIRRLSRRGLAGAALEGMLSTSAKFVVVMDGDLQHDEARIVEMLSVLRGGEADIVVASRYCSDKQDITGLSRIRQFGSQIAVRLTQGLLKTKLSDPMSGFFMVDSEVVDRVANKLSPKGFKILLDILTSSPAPLSVREIPASFRPRIHGRSKLDSVVVLDYLGLLVSKISGGFLSIRLLMFALVGLSGLVVNIAVLALLLARHVGFVEAQTAAVLTALTSNYLLNNAFTYRDRRLRGWRVLVGFMSFAAVCSLGVVGAIGVSTLLYQAGAQWWFAGIASAAMGALWNYVVTSAITWSAL